MERIEKRKEETEKRDEKTDVSLDERSKEYGEVGEETYENEL